MPRGGAIARMTPPGFYTSSMVARLVGVSPDTVKRWRDAGHLPPDDEKKFGGVTVYYYNAESIERANALNNGLGTLSERAAAFDQLQRAG